MHPDNMQNQKYVPRQAHTKYAVIPLPAALEDHIYAQVKFLFPNGKVQRYQNSLLEMTRDPNVKRVVLRR